MSEIKYIAEKLNVSELLVRILAKRGFQDYESMARFIGRLKEPKLDPMEIHGVKDACQLLIYHLERGSKIVIYGDYDVDGITGGSVYQEYLSRHSNNVSYYIPDRIEDGYGININALKKLKNQGTDLVLTVDNGIGRCDVAELAKELNLDLIITDHHEPGEAIPDCIVVNPKIGMQYPELAGVGVAFLVCSALERIKPTHGVIDLLDLVAIGTVADVVPLIGLNRPLVSAGLKVASRKERIGLKELIEQNKLNVDEYNSLRSTDIAFKLAPCLNAAGRIDRADAGVKLLTSQDAKESQLMASKLLEINEQRKDLTQEVYEKVEYFIKEKNIDTSKAIVYYGEGSHHGVLGIVASKIMEKYKVPALILGLAEKDGLKTYTGSCRAPAGFNLFDAITGCKDIIAGGGGHACAAGVSVPVENISTFNIRVNDLLFSNLDNNKTSSGLRLDLEIPLLMVNESLLDEISLLEPTGQSNPEVTFLTQSVEIIEIKELRNNMGIRLKIKQGSKVLNCIGFRLSPEGLAVGSIVDIIYTPEWNFFPPGSRPSIQLRLKNIIKS